MKDYGFVLRTAAAWIERMRGDADDADVAWMVAELRELESEVLPQLISERNALKADAARLDAFQDRGAKIRQRTDEMFELTWIDKTGMTETHVAETLREAIDAAMSS
jgi:hypothetical protein